MLFRHFNIYMYCRHEKNVQDHISPYSQSYTYDIYGVYSHPFTSSKSVGKLFPRIFSFVFNSMIVILIIIFMNLINIVICSTFTI